MKNLRPPHFHRLFVFLLPVAIVLFFVFAEKATFKSNAQAQPIAEPVNNLDSLNVSGADPFVCLIPDDGGILPCHANLIADEIPLPRSVKAPVLNESCDGGEAAGFPCKNIDLLAHLPLSEFNNVRASDIWGWTDPETGAEIVIMTQRDQVAFIDISDPIDPGVLGFLPKPITANSSAWRDVKTYGNYAYIVGDITADYGMQIFDLTQLRSVTETTTFEADARYQGVKSTHNIVINEQTGLAALVGVSLGNERCNGGMHLVDLKADPLDPPFVGCVSQDGYVHDAQCVVYHGPDVAHAGQEICFNYNTSAVTIVDVTDRSDPVQLSRTTYTQSAYTHQGWVTADHKYLLVDDESDETTFDINTTTLIFDISDLDSPQLVDVYTADTAAIDHNQYVHLGYSFQANYRAGLRILDTKNVESGVLEEVAYFDIYPADDDAKFNAAWSSYPYFGSGVIAMSGVEQGLFLMRPTGLETYRAEVEAAEVISVLAGSEITHIVPIRTIGADDAYAVSIVSDVIEVTLNGSAIVEGSSKAPSLVELTLSIPSTLVGTYSVTINFESQNRSGTVLSKTVEINSLLEPFYGVDLSPVGSAKIQGDLIVQEYTVENRSNLADRYQIAVEGEKWEYELDVSETLTIPASLPYSFVVTGTIGAIGASDLHTVTVQSLNDQNLKRSIASEVELDVGVNASTFAPQTGLPGELITATITFENTGETKDQFEIGLTAGRWSSTLSASQTVLLDPGGSDSIVVLVEVGSNGIDELGLQIRSKRSGELLAERFFQTSTFVAYMPSVYR